MTESGFYPEGGACIQHPHRSALFVPFDLYLPLSMGVARAPVRNTNFIWSLQAFDSSSSPHMIKNERFAPRANFSGGAVFAWPPSAMLLQIKVTQGENSMQCCKLL